MKPKFTHTQTRGVLAGAYRGRKISERALLTHLVFMDGNLEVRTGCRQDLESLVDSEAATSDQPTCPVCAKRWAKVLGEGSE